MKNSQYFWKDGKSAMDKRNEENRRTMIVLVAMVIMAFVVFFAVGIAWIIL